MKTLIVSDRQWDLAYSILLLFCCGVLLYPGLLNSQVPVFRDAYHFYYPQAVWLDHCAKAGDWFPRWNATENLGVSTAGQATASLYYPLRVLYFLPGSVAQRFAVYIMIHLLVAACGMRCAAAQLGCRVHSAWLAGTCFSLSCPVVFQHCNLVYLVGASWIGFAMAALINRVRQSQSSHLLSCLGFSAATSMMLLGGDPHSAVNTYVVAAVLLVGRPWVVGKVDAFAAHVGQLRTLGSKWKPNTSSRLMELAKSTSWLGVALLILVTATSIQWIPMHRWAAVSSRRQPAASEITADADMQFEYQVLQARVNQVIAPGHRIYEFSLSPWHIFTLWWPTLGGHYLPENSRWFSAIPAEGRMWVPSLYLGTLPGLFLIAAFFSRRCGSEGRWLKLLVVLTLLLSLGNYSAVWLVRQLCSELGLQQWTKGFPPDSTGSVYWLLVELLPGYEGFRYPAKWSVWFVALAAMLVARYAQGDRRPNKWLLWTYASVSLLLVVTSLGWSVWSQFSPADEHLGREVWNEWFTAAAFDPWLAAPRLQAVLWSGLLAAAIPLAILLWYAMKLKEVSQSFIVVLTAAEMSLVAMQWVVFSSPREFNVPSQVRLDGSVLVWVDVAEADLRRDSTNGKSQFSVQELADYQSIFLLGKMASGIELANLASSQSLEPLQVRKLQKLLAGLDNMTVNQPELDAVLRQLGVTHRLVRLHRDRTNDQVVSEPSNRAGDGKVAFDDSLGNSFAWQAIPGSRELCEWLATDNQQSAGDQAFGQLAWQWNSSCELALSVRSSQSGAVLVRQFNDGGWVASLASDGGNQQLALSAPNSLFIEIAVPAGEWTVVLKRKWLW
ncbi:MAG: hypothetical protein KDB22_25745 [Planctomycetales bacterium]|nr:hypothetical protein [Planctomycetales bacterium]